MATEHIYIHIVSYPEAMPSAMSGISDLLQIANRFSGSTQFQCKTVTPDDEITPKGRQVVLVPPCLSEQLPDVKAYGIASALSRWHQAGATIAANCAAVFWLAEAGLLNGKMATTHWQLFDRLAKSYPEIKAIDRRKMVIDQGQVMTAAGLYAFQDLILQLIARFCSFDVAKSVADFSLLDLNGRIQSYYQRFIPDFNHQDELVLKAQNQCEQLNLTELSVGRLAERVHVAERTLTRRFKQTLGISPGHYIQQLRVERSKQMLELSRQGVEQIAIQVGYNDLSNFSRAFKRISGISPAEYRDRAAVRENLQ